MDTVRISIARLLALGVPLAWQDAVAVAQEAAMHSDLDGAMDGRPPLVSGDTCYITPDGDLDLPVTTDVESPHAIRMLLREMLAGRDAPDALKSLAQGHVTHDMYGELGRFPVPNRRDAIAKLAARALALQAHPHDGPPPVPAARPATAPATAPAAAAVSPAPQLAPEPAPAPVVAAQAPTTPRRPASLPAVPNASLTPEVAITADLRLRLKSVNAGAARREPARFTPSRAVWSAGGVLAAGALAALVWSAGSALGLRRAPALLEAKGSLNMLPVWPFPATVVAASPGASATRPPQSVAASPTSPFRDNASNATVNARLPAASASLLAPDTDASRVESAWPASNPAGNVVPAPPVPAGALRVETAPATTPLAAAEPPAVAAPSPVASPAAGRRAGAVGAGRGQAFRRETFSAGDADVAPPDLRRQQLPTAVLEPGTAVPEGWPYLMLVVDETGVVESVRLTARIPPPGQSLYRHRMLVSAAKAWQFEPARKNGQPVRYAIRVPLEP